MKKLLMCAIFLGITLGAFAYGNDYYGSTSNSFDVGVVIAVLIFTRLAFIPLIGVMAKDRKVSSTPWILCGILLSVVISTLLLAMCISTPKQAANRLHAIEIEREKLKNSSNQ